MMKRRGYTVFQAIHLVIGYLLGELSDEEKKTYTQLLKDTGLRGEDWDGKALQRELRKDKRFDAEEAYRQFLHRVPRKSFIRRVRWSRVAALWLLPLMIGAVGWYFGHRGDSEQKIMAQIYPVSSKAFVELADGRNIELNALGDTLAEVDGTLIRHDSGKLVYSGKMNSENKLLYNVLNVPRGGEYTLCLSDGSKVWLNSASRLRYPVQFAGNRREVFLSGEAYFEVAHDTEHPFVVNTSLGKVEVLGTEFNVQDYEDEKQVVTTLVNGKVKYSNGVGKDCLLNPGYQVIAHQQGGDLQVQKVNLKEYVGWKEGMYTFYDYTLEKIMRTVERNYDVQVFFAAEDLKMLRFTGDLEKYDHVEKFLRFIELGGDVAFVVEGKTIRIGHK